MMNLKKKFYFKSIFIIVLLLFICACSTPKKKSAYEPFREEIIEPTRREEPEKEELVEDDTHVLKREVIAEGGEEKEYPGIEGRFMELPKLKDIYFAFDKYELTKESRRVLADNINLLKNLPNSRIQVEGHCDERGSVEYNLTLGEKRAQAVEKYLSSLNFPSMNISTISYGEEMPVDPRHNEEAWSKNRRAHIIILTD
ncbi:MAG: peptidoglycan-associated lipoprotein Pal [bacterium]